MGRKYPTIATAVTAMIAQACGLVTSNPSPPAGDSPTGGSAGSASQAGNATAGATGVAGSLALGGIGGAGAVEPPCVIDDVLEDQAVTEIGGQRTFYSWTTQEQVDELRAGTELFSRSERAGQGRGLLFVSLAELAASADGEVADLADVLVNQVFAKARYAWTNPWATLLGFPGESYGDQLLQIELDAEAWIARFELGILSVVDRDGRHVPLDEALKTPERIGAIFHQSRGEDANGYCGTFSQGAVGYREFALGNLSRVKRWSLATQEIAERIEADIAALRAFTEQLACFEAPADWSSRVMCEWGGQSYAEQPLRSYDFCVGLPSELYRPSPENLEALIAALESSRPTGEPLVVTRE